MKEIVRFRRWCLSCHRGGDVGYVDIRVVGIVVEAPADSDLLRRRAGVYHGSLVDDTAARGKQREHRANNDNERDFEWPDERGRVPQSTVAIRLPPPQNCCPTVDDEEVDVERCRKESSLCATANPHRAQGERARATHSVSGLVLLLVVSLRDAHRLEPLIVPLLLPCHRVKSILELASDRLDVEKNWAAKAAL